MLNYSSKGIDWLATVLTALLYASFGIFQVISGGRYVFITLAAAILLLKSRGKIVFELNAYYLFNAALIIYAAATSLWAWDSRYSLELAKRMLDTFLCSVLIYMAYQDDPSPRLLTLGCKIGGYIVALYMFMYYGPRQLLQMLQNEVRVDNDIGNSNIFGMMVAYSCVLEFLEVAQKKRLTLTAPLVFPSILIIAATQSRKSLLIIAAGLVMTVCYYAFDPRQKMRSVMRLTCVALCAVYMLNVFQHIPIFSGIISRMMLIVNYAHGGEGVGFSIKERSQMIELGWEQFLQTPIGGIGFGNAIVLTAKYNDVPYVYLHNNFVELLCCGGAIGFIIYYSRYIYIFWMMMKNSQWNNPDFVTCGILAIIVIVMDYGFVSYYDKMIQIFHVIMFLQVHALARKDDIPEKLPAPLPSKYIRNMDLYGQELAARQAGLQKAKPGSYLKNR